MKDNKQTPKRKIKRPRYLNLSHLIKITKEERKKG